jgi:YidC/Oxa1 family membrane protein insertase
VFQTLLVNPLFNLLILIYGVIPGHDLGVAVIVMSVIVRLALWPLVAKQLHSQRVMQQLAPELAKIRTKAKGDKQLESRMMMDLYKEKGVSPFSSFGLLLIQLPIFIALYSVFNEALKPSEIAKLAYEPIRQLGAIKDIISSPESFKPSLLGLVNLTKPNDVLAFLAGATQFYQGKQLMPKHLDSKDPAAQTTKIMSYLFPVLSFFIARSLPSALALYWAITSLVAIVQQHLVLQQDVEEMEEVAGSGTGHKKAAVKPKKIGAGK